MIECIVNGSVKLKGTTLERIHGVHVGHRSVRWSQSC